MRAPLADLSPAQPPRPVRAVQELLRQLRAAALPGPGRAAARVAFVLDDYNALYGASGYGVLKADSTPQQAQRRVLAAGQLELVGP